MKLKLLVFIFLHVFLVGCSEMTDWQTYSDAGWEKYENEKFKEAIDLYNIAYKKIHFGVFIDKKGLAALTTNMAATYRALGDFKNAKKYYFESLTAWEKLVGKSHENYATIANNYSQFLSQQSEFEEALRYALEAFEIRSKVYGENSEDVVISHRGISRIYLGLGQFEKALYHAKSALGLAIIAQGEGSELVASSQLTLGRTYRAGGDNSNASAHITEAIKIYESVAQKSTRSADTINELALIQQNSKEFSLANDNFHKATEMYREIYDKNHPYIAIMHENIALNYLDWGKIDNSFQAIQESVKISEAVFGPEHQYTIKVRTICNQIGELNQSSTELCGG